MHARGSIRGLLSFRYLYIAHHLPPHLPGSATNYSLVRVSPGGGYLPRWNAILSTTSLESEPLARPHVVRFLSQSARAQGWAALFTYTIQKEQTPSKWLVLEITGRPQYVGQTS